MNAAKKKRSRKPPLEASSGRNKFYRQGPADHIKRTGFIGHIAFHADPNEDGPPSLSFGTDWDERLLSKKEAQDVVRQGMTSEWARDIGEKLADTGAAMLHFWTTPKGVSIDDCAPACPASAEARALLAPTKGNA